MDKKLKSLWHRIWGLSAYPIEVHMPWKAYFRKDVRDYCRTCQDKMNSKDCLDAMQKQYDEMVFDSICFGTTATYVE